MIKERKDIKILYMSDHISLMTGFAKVGRAILPRLQKMDYQIEHLAWCYQRKTEKNFPEITKNIITYPAEAVDYPTLKFGKATLAGILQEVKPDILFTQGDVFMVDFIPQILDKMGKDRPIWLSFFPIDGLPVPDNWLPTIEQMDISAIYTEFGKDEVIKASNGELKPLAIHLGVDSKIYRPTDKVEAKKMLGIEGKFIVGNLARNQIRKNLDAVIKAFSIFCQDKPDTMLYLHCAPRKYKPTQRRTELKADVGWDLLDLTRRYKLKNRVLFPTNVGPDEGVSEEVLASIINAWDIAVFPSQGEGFNLPLCEAMACGIPCIATNYAAHKELLTGRGELINSYFQICIHDNIERAYPIMPDFLTKMNLLYHDKELRKKYSQKGIVLAKKLTWDSTAKKFDDAIQNYYTDREKIKFEVME